jgi:threonine synthase
VRAQPIYLLNSVNPYRIEGQKTPAFELCEQMDWQVPEHVICPGGNLANASALAKGFAEMRLLGLIARVPRISIIQAEGANPLYLAMHESHGAELTPMLAETRASAIRIGNPASWRKAVDALKTTGGWCEQVDEQQIALAKAEIGAEGIGCEPASAVTLAGLKKLVGDGRIGAEERVVLILTGHTLKDSDYTIRYHRQELLTAEEERAMPEPDRHQHELLRCPPIVLDAQRDTVLKALEAQMARASRTAIAFA